MNLDLEAPPTAGGSKFSKWFATSQVGMATGENPDQQGDSRRSSINEDYFGNLLRGQCQ